MVGVVSLCPGAPLSVCAAMDFSVDGAGVSGVIDSVRSGRGKQCSPCTGTKRALLAPLAVGMSQCGATAGTAQGVLDAAGVDVIHAIAS
jgi:hypothetical protein